MSPIQMSEGWPPPITPDEQAAMDAADIAWQKAERERCTQCGCNWVQCQCGDPLEDEAV